MTRERESCRPQIVFITGATSDFGAAFARRFADIGSKLILHGRDAGKLEALSRSLPSVPKHSIVADLGRPEEMEKAIADLPAAFRDIDLLINNAGGALGLDRFHEISLADADAMIDANCRAVVQVSRLVMPRMAERKTGHVINISSVAANWPYPGGNVYGACKAFSRQLSLAMRCDLQGTNIRVTSIEPGLCETTFSLKRFKGDAGRAAKVYANTQPLTAEDIAESVFWVATLPPHMNVNSLEVMPTKQSWSSFAVERDD